MTNKQELQTLDKDHKKAGTAGVIHLTTQGGGECKPLEGQWRHQKGIIRWLSRDDTIGSISEYLFYLFSLDICLPHWRL